jgi:hypothetical protein
LVGSDSPDEGEDETEGLQDLRVDLDELFDESVHLPDVDRETERFEEIGKSGEDETPDS